MIETLQKKLTQATGLAVRLAPTNLAETHPALVLVFSGYTADDWGRMICSWRLDLVAQGDKAGKYLTSVMEAAYKTAKVLQDPTALGALSATKVQDGDITALGEEGQWRHQWRESWQLTMEV